MKGINIARYTSGDPVAVGALQQYGFGYDLAKGTDTVVTTLNRVKYFLEKYFSIQQPTSRLVQGIIEETSSGEYIGDGIDLSMNICKLFKIQVNKFRQGVDKLLREGRLRKEKIV